VVEVHGQLGLVQEHLHEAWVVCDVRQDALDHHGPHAASGSVLAREEDLGHASERHASEDLETTKARDGGRS
jgi:hypothetical protein